jgi:hypothetical protein
MIGGGVRRRANDGALTSWAHVGGRFTCVPFRGLRVCPRGSYRVLLPLLCVVLRGLFRLSAAPTVVLLTLPLAVPVRVVPISVLLLGVLPSLGGGSVTARVLRGWRD